jgi:tRNA uridine 5-carboxymethylaminomethyl modification enzyme
MLRLARDTTISAVVANEVLAETGSTSIDAAARVAELARRPGVGIARLLHAAGVAGVGEDAEWADIELKYAGYLTRERNAAARVAEMDDFELPTDLDYSELEALSTEARQKLSVAQPRSLGQAGRISGVSPSDLQSLVVAVLRRRRGGCFT